MKHLFAYALVPALLLAGCSKPDQSSGTSGRTLTIAMLPKSKGNQYFVTCEKGAQQALRELNVGRSEFIFDGPTNTDPAKQNEIVENFITLGVDVIVAACENREGIATVLKKAQDKGIKVLTYDSDTLPEARSFFVNQATAEGIGQTLMDTAAQLCGEEGEFAIITATLTAANMIEWRKHIEARLAEKYPRMKLVDTKPCDDQKDKAQQEAANLLSANPNLKCLMAICSPAVPGAAEAVKQAGKAGVVKVLGLGLPNENRAYVKDGTTQAVILWKVEDLGYLAVRAAADLVAGKLTSGATSYDAGRLGNVEVRGDNLILGQPFIFTKENIDQFDF